MNQFCAAHRIETEAILLGKEVASPKRGVRSKRVKFERGKGKIELATGAPSYSTTTPMPAGFFGKAGGWRLFHLERIRILHRLIGEGISPIKKNESSCLPTKDSTSADVLQWEQDLSLIQNCGQALDSSRHKLTFGAFSRGGGGDSTLSPLSL